MATKEGNAGYYLMQDGTYADPGSLKAGKDGVLRNENGVGAALNAAGEPMTMAAATESSKNAEAAKAGVSDAPPPDGAVRPVSTEDVPATKAKPAEAASAKPAKPE